MEWARAVLSGRILEVIASRAGRMKLGVLEVKPLAVAGTFDYGFVLELSEHVPFRIDQGSAFFVRLGRDLTTYLRIGGLVSGRWGRLALDQDRIGIELSGIVSDVLTPIEPKRSTGFDSPKVGEDDEDRSESASS
jgi:hypothetical protein